ncbi:Sec-independent protein translocase subunit TatA/TatB [Mucilaginibacter ginkgonis]|uniref:Sec-independent protein translocase protein TatA n=1 Tax=Mucilaginibacter ginkgonis TaxID=2682091 RepID=A0A6I4I472_9SPHI|nr:twin-arginine translocase TatA/TatE family subunit [Mucilaginibacter ginkgonis]QQL48789.1 twin-arginine translocase TatA/TatE family subunit [Mucilaginibacter ginkgonis]
MLHPIFLFLNIGSSEMILIVFVALMLFGGDKLPQIAKGLGKGIRDFKDASEGVKRELQNQIENFEAKPPVESAPGRTDADLNFPPVANTAAVTDPFAPANSTVEEHETPLTEERTTNTTDTQTTPAEHSHADVSHLIEQPEVTKVAENHLSITHVDDGAAKEPKDKATT